MIRLRNLWKDEEGFSIIEGLIAGAIVLFAVVAILRMVTAGSQDVLGNKVRSVAQTQAVYGAERVRSAEFDDLLSLYGTWSIDKYVTGEGYATTDVMRDQINYTTVTHYLAGDTNGDGEVDAFDYIVATVTVTWDRPEPIRPIEMTVYKTP